VLVRPLVLLVLLVLLALRRIAWEFAVRHWHTTPVRPLRVPAPGRIDATAARGRANGWL
jgi:hypothetical protein